MMYASGAPMVIPIQPSEKSSLKSSILRLLSEKPVCLPRPALHQTAKFLSS